MKTTTLNMILAALAALALALVAIAFTTGCSSGDDDSNCMATTGCPDASSATVDADPLTPDADTTPDANPDPCAAYAEWPSDNWNCFFEGQNALADCQADLGLVAENGICWAACMPCPMPADFIQTPSQVRFSCIPNGSSDTMTCYHNGF